MKRTTISRSRLGGLAAAALVLAVAAPAAAQDTVQTAQDTVQTAQVTQPPRTHVVQKGETLWGLAQMFLGDALLWPEIYRLNTLVVEDPHWIFPGEELRLAPAESTAVAMAPVPVDTTTPAAPPDTAKVAEQQQAVSRPVVDSQPPDTVTAPVAAPPPPPPVQESGPTVFARKPAAASGLEVSAGRVARRTLHRGDFYAAGFLTENQKLPWGRVTRTSQLGAGAGAGSSALIYGQVHVQAPEGASYHVGDSLLVARIAEQVPGWGRTVIPTGIVRVTYASGRDAVGELVAQYGRVSSDDAVIPVEPFRDPGMQRPVPVENGMTGKIISARDQRTVPGQQSIFFIDKGRADGVVAGDVFEVVQQVASPANAPAREIALLQVVHVRDHSSAGMVTQIFAQGTAAGVTVRLIRKMPS